MTSVRNMDAGDLRSFLAERVAIGTLGFRRYEYLVGRISRLAGLTKAQVLANLASDLRN